MLPSLRVPLLFVAGSHDRKFVQLGRAMAGFCEGAGHSVGVSTDDSTWGIDDSMATHGGAQSRAVQIDMDGENRRESTGSSERDGESSVETVAGMNSINAVFREVIGSGHAVHSERPEKLLTVLIEWCRM